MLNCLFERPLFVLLLCVALGWLYALPKYEFTDPWMVILRSKPILFYFPLSLSTEVHFKHHNRLRASLVEFNDALYSVLQSKYHTTTQLNKKYWTGITLASFGHLKMNELFLEFTFCVTALQDRGVSSISESCK